jgi:hypothetical protein
LDIGSNAGGNCRIDPGRNHPRAKTADQAVAQGGSSAAYEAKKNPLVAVVLPARYGALNPTSVLRDEIGNSCSTTPCCRSAVTWMPSTSRSGWMMSSMRSGPAASPKPRFITSGHRDPQQAWVAHFPTW